jgi:hypothetical protein
MTVDWLNTVLRDGRQRQRAASTLDLAIHQPDAPLFNVKAPGFVSRSEQNFRCLYPENGSSQTAKNARIAKK